MKLYSVVYFDTAFTNHHLNYLLCNARYISLQQWALWYALFVRDFLKINGCFFDISFYFIAC